MKALLIPLVAIGLAACAAAPVAEIPEPLFADALFAPQAGTDPSAGLFTLSDEMVQFADQRIAPLIDRRGPYVGLFDALRTELKLDYDTARTRTASEAFGGRTGNCLSLVIMTAAFAKHFHVPVTYQSVYSRDTWTRSNGIAFLSGHVNLVLGKRNAGERDPLYLPAVVDFVEPDTAARYFSRPLTEETVIAMYLNNRAAETMVDDNNADAAYWLAREAVRKDPSFAAAINTLGLVYARHGNPAQAEFAFRTALEREPGNVNVLGNLAGLLERTGRAEEAAELRQQLADLAPYPPFYFLDAGWMALLRGDNEKALVLLQKELQRMPYDDEVHFAIAVADLRLGLVNAARRHLNIALEGSRTRERHDIYAAKLATLKDPSRRPPPDDATRLQ